MAAYTVDSDNIFLHCRRGKMEVCKLKHLSKAQVEDGHWEPLLSINNNALKIVDVGGQTVEVTGANFEKLKKDLSASRLRVNREGLCFCKPGDNTATPVKYYRLFDLFDWSKYGVEVPFLNTKCAKRVRNALDLEKHRKEKLEKQEKEIATLTDKLEKKKKEIARLKDPRLRISIVKYPSDNFQTAGPQDRCKEAPKINYRTEFYPIYAKMSQEIESRIPKISIQPGFDYDPKDWFALTGYTGDKTWSDYRAIMIYYDGKRARGECPKCNDEVPFPTDKPPKHPFPPGFHVFKVDGTGCRWGIIYSLKKSKFLYR